ncbi:MAG TPA: SdiA-regulated domain-containing protein, partial [Flavisolibacter sp.]|nr:SdiA-regulated domain-containing protein [Flavisolibacter sp.]
MILDKKLSEISGLFYLPDENSFLAIADNKQKVYRVTVDGKESDYFEDEFAEQDDFEDVVKVGNTVYVLISDGTIIDIKRADSNLITHRYTFPTTDSTNKNDFETLYYDSTSQGLIMLCKECEVEKGRNRRTAYRFDLATRQFDSTPFYTITTKSVADRLKDGKVDFYPSAAAFNPIDQRLYILSSAGQ